jgi:hypothetical protein
MIFFPWSLCSTPTVCENVIKRYSSPFIHTRRKKWKARVLKFFVAFHVLFSDFIWQYNIEVPSVDPRWHASTQFQDMGFHH